MYVGEALFLGAALVMETYLTLSAKTSYAEVLMISGGRHDRDYTSSEVFMFDLNGRRQMCAWPYLPKDIMYHTMDLVNSGDRSIPGKLTVCGGKNNERSCLQLHVGEYGGWLEVARTQQKRFAHMSWMTEAGLLLMGGIGHKIGHTTELVLPTSDAVQVGPKFKLLHEGGDGTCAIPVIGGLIVTGGASYPVREKFVTHYSAPQLKGWSERDGAEYTEGGEATEMAQMNRGRTSHACGSISTIEDLNNDKQVIIVAGGWDSNYLSDVEILDIMHGNLVDAVWRSSTPLRAPNSYMKGANVGLKFYLTGGHTVSGDDWRMKSQVLSFDPSTETWVHEGNLNEGLSGHALTGFWDGAGPMSMCSYFY